MSDYVPIQDLTIVNSIDDSDMFPLSDGIGAYAVRGSTIKSYAAADAAAAAADAVASKTAAQNAATAAGNAQTAAESAQSYTEGAAADAETAANAALAAENNALAPLTSINVIDGYINYGYDTPANYAADSSASYATRCGVKRAGTVITLNGDTITANSKAVTIRLNGTVSRTTTPNTEFVSGDTFVTGHVYRITVKKISGSAIRDNADYMPSVSVYKAGTSSSVGSAAYDADAGYMERTFTPEANAQYNLCFYVAYNVTLTNAVYCVLMEDLTAKALNVPEIADRVNAIHHLVDYGYGIPENLAEVEGVDGPLIAIKRENTRITLNGSVGSVALKYKISGRVYRASRVSEFTDSAGITLISGHRYRVVVTQISGSSTLSGQNFMASVSVYKKGETSTVGAAVLRFDAGINYREFVAESTEYHICLFMVSGVVFSNAVFEVTLQDLTADAIFTDLSDKPWYEDEFTDTLSKIRTENTEPALVFPWVTDIHRYKASVQNFPDMISYMRKLSKSIKCDFILNTGDTIEGDQTQATSLGQAYDSIGELQDIGLPFYYVNGNHDNNPYISSGALVFTLRQVFGGFFAATKGITFNTNENGTDYYFDHDNLGIRFISVNSCNPTIARNYGFGQSTASWLETALNTDHLVVFATHVSPFKEHVWNNIDPGNAASIRAALESFVENGGKLVLLTGHSHVDAEWVNPYVEITNVCQKFDQADTSDDGYQVMSGMIDGIRAPERIVDTASEDAWSAVILKPTSGEIDVIRYGAGIDRYIHYDPIAPNTAIPKLSGTVTWHTSDSSVATVSNGVITGVGSGRCAVFAKDVSGNIEVWVVEV